MWNLVLEKENFKFAASHFAIFGPYCGERLHGHNYYLKLTLKVEALDPQLGLGIEFNEIKPLVLETCSQLDEFVLLPEASPYLTIDKDTNYPDNLMVKFADKVYSIPRVDVKPMPLLNISCEELSRWFADQLKQSLCKYKNIKQITVAIQETKGQAADYTVLVN